VNQIVPPSSIGRPTPSLAAREAPAHVITSDAEAIAVAKALAEDFAVESVARDKERRLPFAEVERFSQSGLWGITVPKAHGGAEVSAVTVAEITAIISAVDGSLGQIPQNHYYIVEALRLDASEAQKRFYFKRVLEGDRLGNALSEIGGKHPMDYKTILRREGDGFILHGQKYYCTGALFAHWIACVPLDEQGRRAIVFVPRDTPGLTLVDDWMGFGQKTTASGTTVFDTIAVDAFAVIDHQKAFDRPTRMGSFAQLIHAAIDVGIARGAFAVGLDHLRRHARPYAPSGIEKVTDDPHMIATVGDLQVRLSAANAMLERAGTFVDRAGAEPTQANVEAASIAVAEAKVVANDVSLLLSAKLFELAGTRSTLESLDLDRFWRNARTHTLHDPVRWKYHFIGDYWLNGKAPPRTGTL
jgi:SfnB family sulfur acquisition oxidoreductase